MPSGLRAMVPAAWTLCSAEWDHCSGVKDWACGEFVFLSLCGTQHSRNGIANSISPLLVGCTRSLRRLEPCVQQASELFPRLYLLSKLMAATCTLLNVSPRQRLVAQEFSFVSLENFVDLLAFFYLSKFLSSFPIII